MANSFPWSLTHGTGATQGPRQHPDKPTPPGSGEARHSRHYTWDTTEPMVRNTQGAQRYWRVGRSPQCGSEARQVHVMKVRARPQHPFEILDQGGPLSPRSGLTALSG